LAKNPCPNTTYHKKPSLQPREVMSANMTLEEKFRALMKNYEQMRAHNEEIRNQNAYLRRQLGDVMKKRRKDISKVTIFYLLQI